MSCAGELGITAITRNEIVINQQLHAFIPSSQVKAEFLLNVIASQKPQIGGLATKTAVPYLNKNNCNSIQIPLPPLVDEQEAIAEVLSDEDALIESLEQLLAKKRNLKQGAMQELLTGTKRLPGFSGKWSTVAFGTLYGKVFDRSPISSRDGKEHGAYPLFVSGGALKWTDTALYRATEALIFSDGGVFSVRYFSGNFAVTDHCYTLTLCPGKANMAFLYAWFRLNEQMLDCLTFKGSGLRNLNKAALASIEVPQPNLAEQAAIATILSEMDAEIAVLEAKLDKARQLKQGMMQELLTGKIRLT